MKPISIFKKPISVLLTFCFVLALVSFSSIPTKAQDGELSPEEEKAALEQRIKETNNKLAELEEESASTKEHLDLLNEKIEYLEQEEKLISADVEEYRLNVDALQLECEENEKAITATESEIEEINAKLVEADRAYNENYDAYCKRLRAMYISGESDVYTFLLMSNDISQLFTRFEMLRRVAKRDGELLEAIRTELKNMENAAAELSEKSGVLTAQRTELLKSKESLERSLTELGIKQSELDARKMNLSAERASANVILKKLSDETGYYTEYLQDDEETLKELDRRFEEAQRKYEDSLKTTTSTTTEPSTGGRKPAGSTTTTQKSGSRYIELTYPVPSQKNITCGINGYAGHSGADFACPTGSAVVAAESGTVIISEDLTYDDGSYRSYGRYIMIMHDKTTPSGDPVFTLYAHNSERLVSEGQHVEKGQQIARSGSTGNSTGPHCHFEVRTPSSSYGDCKDPVKYLP